VERVVSAEERELERGALRRPGDARLKGAPVLDDEARRLVDDLAHERRRQDHALHSFGGHFFCMVLAQKKTHIYSWTVDLL
jgi:hypothetical protein